MVNSNKCKLQSVSIDNIKRPRPCASANREARLAHFVKQSSESDTKVALLTNEINGYYVACVDVCREEL